VTGQDQNGGYDDVGLATAIALVNALAVDVPDDPTGAVRRVLAVDPPSVEALAARDLPGLEALAGRLHAVAVSLAAGDVDGAAPEINDLLAEHSAHPHLAREDGRWRLHHHPADAAVVPMWTAICAEAFARLVGTDRHHRVGICESADCRRVFVDESRNASRRFCSTRCQNRSKAAAFRARRRAR
jgi:predicted RNA-binding Zn ribbon-like protein